MQQLTVVLPEASTARHMQLWQSKQCRHAVSCNLVFVCQAPDGQTFYTYAKSQEYWQSLGQAPVDEPVTDASRLSNKRFARLPVGWEVQAIHHAAGDKPRQVMTHEHSC